MENTGFTRNFVLEDFGLAHLMYMEVEENFFHVDTKGLITWVGLARLAWLVSVCRDLGTLVKRNKNQLRDYMTTGPARLAEIPVSRCRDPG